MSKTLIIAEKPSVANDIAKTLGGFTKHDEYFESDEYVLSSAVGHLLEIAVPEEYDVKRGKWTFANLPMIPPHFALNPIAKTESRLKVLNKLIKRKDVTALINACDAGREGELIFRLIAQNAKAKQPIQRLWLQSMTPNAIREGFAQLRSDEEMMPLADAARCRSEADWLIGINGTRAMTAFNSKEGGFYLTTVGRVQTPTLSIVVEREEKIKNFVPRDYWEVRAEFVCAAGVYEGRWFDTKFKKDENRSGKARRAAVEQGRGRIDRRRLPRQDRHRHRRIEADHVDVAGAVRPDQPAARSQRRFGFSAKNTLGLAQALYEKHKVLTYPRTDSRHLPEDYIATRQADAGDDVGKQQLPAVRQADPEQGLGQAEQAHLRQRQDQRSLRDHPDDAGAEKPVGAGTEAVRPRTQALPGGVLPGGRIPGDDAHHRSLGPSVQDRRQGDGQSGLAGDLRQGSGRRQGPG